MIDSGGNGSRLRESIEQKDAIQALLASPGWHILMAILDAQIGSESEHILLSPIGVKYATPLEQEFAKGHVHGMKVIKAVALSMLDEAEAIVESEQGNGSTDNRDRDQYDAELEPELAFG